MNRLGAVYMMTVYLVLGMGAAASTQTSEPFLCSYTLMANVGIDVNIPVGESTFLNGRRRILQSQSQGARGIHRRGAMVHLGRWYWISARYSLARVSGVGAVIASQAHQSCAKRRLGR